MWLIKRGLIPRLFQGTFTCSYDEWPRYKGDARFGAGLEGSFSSFGETSLVVLTLRCQIGNGGEAAE